MKNHKSNHPIMFLVYVMVLFFFISCDSTNSTEPNLHANYKIIFSSARSLNSFDIYSMDIDGNNITQITQNGRNDSRPKVTPNGSQIYYKSLWYDASGYRCIDIDGSNETVVYEFNEQEPYTTDIYTVNNDKIILLLEVENQRDLFAINSDGIGIVQLTDDHASEYSPQFSHDGLKIIYESGSDICIMNSDGSQKTTLIQQLLHSSSDGMFRFSADDLEILFAAREGSIEDIYRMNVDGIGLTNLTNNPGNDSWPIYSFDESRIAFISTRDDEYDFWRGDIYIMNSDGSDQTRLTFHKMVEKQEILFTPDDEKLIFVSQKDNDTNADQIYSINIDGSNETALTMNPGQNMSPQILVID
jgi:Tol biopolymer transport system component